MGVPQRLIWISLLQLAIILGLGAALVQPFGGIGVAVAVGISMLVVLVLAHMLVRRNMDIHTLRYIGYALLACGLTIGSYYVVSQLFAVDTLPIVVRLIVKGVYAVLSFYVCMFVLQPHGTVERMRYVVRLAARS